MLLPGNLKKLFDERGELQRKLEASLAIQHIWPEAFECGRVHSHFEGPRRRDIRGRFKIDQLKFIVERSDGERREFSLSALPPVLAARAEQYRR